MSKRKNYLIQDSLFLVISVGVAIYLVKTGMIHQLVYSIGELKWFGIIAAGMFFTSAFTTAPAIAVLGTFAGTTSLPVLAILGGIGAVIGDYIIFRLIKKRVTRDFQYLLSFSKNKRFKAIFQTKVFRFFVPFIGAMIIASPLPDEIGVAVLGISKINDHWFFPLSFLANGAGILLIGFAAQAIIG